MLRDRSGDGEGFGWGVEHERVGALSLGLSWAGSLAIPRTEEAAFSPQSQGEGGSLALGMSSMSASSRKFGSYLGTIAPGSNRAK